MAKRDSRTRGGRTRRRRAQPVTGKAKPRRLPGKDMRPSWYDRLSPEVQAWWDEADWDDPEFLKPGEHLAILGGGPPVPKKKPSRE